MTFTLLINNSFISKSLFFFRTQNNKKKNVDINWHLNSFFKCRYAWFFLKNSSGPYKFIIPLLWNLILMKLFSVSPPWNEIRWNFRDLSQAKIQNVFSCWIDTWHFIYELSNIICHMSFVTCQIESIFIWNMTYEINCMTEHLSIVSRRFVLLIFLSFNSLYIYIYVCFFSPSFYEKKLGYSILVIISE